MGTIYVKESAETFNRLLQTKVNHLTDGDLLSSKYLNSIGIQTPRNVCIWIDNSIPLGKYISIDEKGNIKVQKIS